MAAGSRLEFQAEVSPKRQPVVTNTISDLAQRQGEEEAEEEVRGGGGDEAGDAAGEPSAVCAGWRIFGSALGRKNRGGLLQLPAAPRFSCDDDDDSPCPSEASTGTQSRERERAFEIADSLEGGMARELGGDFTTPLRRSSRLWRFRVARTSDRLQARLLSEDGDFLMFARLRAEKRTVEFFLYDPEGGEAHKLYDPHSPAFSMTYDEGMIEWRLVKEQCDRCCFSPSHLSCASLGKQQLAVIRHTRRSVGEGVSNGMEVYIPGLYTDGTAVVWCPRLERGDLYARCSGYRQPPLERTVHDTHEVLQLDTKLPVWNEDANCLVLDFKNRAVQPSAKNFQLSLVQKAKHVVCQYGKLGDTNFALDAKCPLSLVQAFGVSLTTLFWT